MVEILPGVPSFGATLGRNLGEGLSAGIGKGLDFAAKLGVAKAKQDPFKQAQQERLEMDSIIKHLDAQIREDVALLKTFPDKKDVPAIQQRLEANRAKRNAFFELRTGHKFPAEEPAKAVEETKDLPEPKKVEKKAKKAKPKFDSNNKEHRAKAEQLYEKYKDTEKVRKQLAKEFEF